MKIFLESLCSEFAEEYVVQEDILGFIIKINVEIEDLGDLSDILDSHGVELIELRSLHAYSTKCEAIFSKIETPISGVL